MTVSGLPDPSKYPHQDEFAIQPMLDAFGALQKKVIKSVEQVSANVNTASPGDFLLLQFQVSQMSQIGESISQVLAQVNAVISNAVRNFRGQ